MSLKPKDSVLIVQNKGGGHGSIAFYVAEDILKKFPQSQVTILQDSCNYSKEPFKSYNELKSKGVNVIDANLSELDTLPSNFLDDLKIDYIVDNWSKSDHNANNIIRIAKLKKAKQLVFISSAGMYNTVESTPLVESDSVKSSNAARKVELEYINSGLDYTFLRPQYLYGHKASKRYLDYFLGRVSRKLPVPIPFHGDQLVALTHLEDIASLITTSLNHNNAVNQIFNAGTDKYVTYKGIVNTLATITNTEVSVLSYKPSDFDFEGKEDVSMFPFRPQTFITSVDKAKLLLSWTPSHDIIEDLKHECNSYLESSKSKDIWDSKQLQLDFEITITKGVDKLLGHPGLPQTLKDKFATENSEFITNELKSTR